MVYCATQRSPPGPLAPFLAPCQGDEDMVIRSHTPTPTHTHTNCDTVDQQADQGLHFLVPATFAHHTRHGTVLFASSFMSSLASCCDCCSLTFNVAPSLGISVYVCVCVCWSYFIDTQRAFAPAVAVCRCARYALAEIRKSSEAVAVGSSRFLSASATATSVSGMGPSPVPSKEV